MDALLAHVKQSFSALAQLLPDAFGIHIERFGEAVIRFIGVQVPAILEVSATVEAESALEQRVLIRRQYLLYPGWCPDVEFTFDAFGIGIQ